MCFISAGFFPSQGHQQHSSENKGYNSKQFKQWGESSHLSYSICYLSTFLGYLHIFTLWAIFLHRDLTNEPSVCLSFCGESDLYLGIRPVSGNSGSHVQGLGPQTEISV